MLKDKESLVVEIEGSRGGSRMRIKKGFLSS